VADSTAVGAGAPGRRPRSTPATASGSSRTASSCREPDALEKSPATASPPTWAARGSTGWKEREKRHRPPGRVTVFSTETGLSSRWRAYLAFASRRSAFSLPLWAICGSLDQPDRAVRRSWSGTRPARWHEARPTAGSGRREKSAIDRADACFGGNASAGSARVPVVQARGKELVRRGREERPSEPHPAAAESRSSPEAGLARSRARSTVCLCRAGSAAAAPRPRLEAREPDPRRSECRHCDRPVRASATARAVVPSPVSRRSRLGDSASQPPPEGAEDRTSAFPESTRPRRHAVAVGAGAGCGRVLSVDLESCDVAGRPSKAQVAGRRRSGPHTRIVVDAVARHEVAGRRKQSPGIHRGTRFSPRAGRARRRAARVRYLCSVPAWPGAACRVSVAAVALGFGRIRSWPQPRSGPIQTTAMSPSTRARCDGRKTNGVVS